jgi:hypothetical protein
MFKILKKSWAKKQIIVIKRVSEDKSNILALVATFMSGVP